MPPRFQVQGSEPGALERLLWLVDAGVGHSVGGELWPAGFSLQYPEDAATAVTAARADAVTTFSAHYAALPDWQRVGGERLRESDRGACELTWDFFVSRPAAWFRDELAEDRALQEKLEADLGRLGGRECQVWWQALSVSGRPDEVVIVLLYAVPDLSRPDLSRRSAQPGQAASEPVYTLRQFKLRARSRD